MSTAAESSIRLVHRQRSVAPIVGKVLGGLACLVGAIVGIAALIDPDVETSLSPVFQLSGAIVTVLLFFGGFWIGQDGVTDFLARRATRDLPHKAITVDRDGLRYSAAWKDGVYEASVPWHEVDGCASRPGLGGHVFLCFDAPGRYPSPPAESGCDPAADPDVVRAQAYLWSMVVSPGPISERERTLLLDTYVFGTPFAVNLAICPGVDTAQLDRQLRHWTDGRCFLLPDP